MKSNRNKEENGPTRRRMDIINSLPCGGQTTIAMLTGVNRQNVSAILNGRKSQNSPRGRRVMNTALLIAAGNKKFGRL